MNKIWPTSQKGSPSLYILMLANNYRTWCDCANKLKGERIILVLEDLDFNRDAQIWQKRVRIAECEKSRFLGVTRRGRGFRNGTLAWFGMIQSGSIRDYVIRGHEDKKCGRFDRKHSGHGHVPLIQTANLRYRALFSPARGTWQRAGYASFYATRLRPSVICPMFLRSGLADNPTVTCSPRRSCDSRWHDVHFFFFFFFIVTGCYLPPRWRTFPVDHQLRFLFVCLGCSTRSVNDIRSRLISRTCQSLDWRTGTRFLPWAS